MIPRSALVLVVTVVSVVPSHAVEVIEDLNVGPAVTIEAPGTYHAGVPFTVSGHAYAQVGLPVIFETAQPLPSHRVDLIVDDTLATYTNSELDGSYRFEWQFGFEAPTTRRVRTVVYGYTAAETSSRTIVMSIDRYFTELWIDPSSAAIYAGESVTLHAFAVDGDGRIADVTGLAMWTSSDTSIATVSGGEVTGISPGATTVSASYAGLSSNASVTVR